MDKASTAALAGLCAMQVVKIFTRNNVSKSLRQLLQHQTYRRQQLAQQLGSKAQHEMLRSGAESSKQSEALAMSPQECVPSISGRRSVPAQRSYLFAQ